MIPRVLMLALLAAVGWFVGRLLASGRHGARPQRERGARRAPEHAAGPMVRDRVCNTFLPAADALSVRLDGSEHHFCSEACRDRFVLERRTAAAGD